MLSGRWLCTNSFLPLLWCTSRSGCRHNLGHRCTHHTDSCRVQSKAADRIKVHIRNSVSCTTTYIGWHNLCTQKVNSLPPPKDPSCTLGLTCIHKFLQRTLHHKCNYHYSHILHSLSREGDTILISVAK